MSCSILRLLRPPHTILFTRNVAWLHLGPYCSSQQHKLCMRLQCRSSLYLRLQRSGGYKTRLQVRDSASTTHSQLVQLTVPQRISKFLRDNPYTKFSLILCARYDWQQLIIVPPFSRFWIRQWLWDRYVLFPHTSSSSDSTSTYTHNQPNKGNAISYSANTQWCHVRCSVCLALSHSCSAASMCSMCWGSDMPVSHSIPDHSMGVKMQHCGGLA